MQDLDKLLAEIKANNRDLTIKQYNLDAKGIEQMDLYKQVYKQNWQFHFRHWWLYNTADGQKQRDRYVKSLNSGDSNND